MAEINLLYEAIRLLSTLGAAALGSIIIWKMLGPGIVRRNGADKIKEWFATLGDDPESEENKQIAKAIGVQTAYAMLNVYQDLETPEGRKKYHPLALAIFNVVSSSMFGTWGQIVKSMQEDGANITGGNPLAAFNNLPPMVAGIAQKAFPGVDLKEIMGVVQWLGSQSGKGGNGSEGGFASPDAVRTLPSGASHRGVTQ